MTWLASRRQRIWDFGSHDHALACIAHSQGTGLIGVYAHPVTVWLALRTDEAFRDSGHMAMT